MSRNIGMNGEKKALDYLSQFNFRLIQQNFLTPFGEIDLIGQIDKCLIFVEVKMRASSRYGLAAEMVSYHKQQKIRKAAMAFLQKNKAYQSLDCRFDVIAITEGQLEWIKAAF